MEMRAIQFKIVQVRNLEALRLNIDNYNHKYYSLLPFEQKIYISPKTCINKKQKKYLTLSVDNFFSSILQEKNTWHIGIIHVHLSVHRHRWNSNKLHNSSHTAQYLEKKNIQYIGPVKQGCEKWRDESGLLWKKNRIINNTRVHVQTIYYADQ